MITTSKHHFDANNPKSIKPDHNAITEWIEVSCTFFTQKTTVTSCWLAFIQRGGGGVGWGWVRNFRVSYFLRFKQLFTIPVLQCLAKFHPDIGSCHLPLESKKGKSREVFRVSCAPAGFRSEALFVGIFLDILCIFFFRVFH